MLFLAYFLLYALVILFGSCIFSFINVVIYRVPLGISVAKGRSFCPRCKATLSPADLVPVLSFLLLRGRCRRCGEKIAPRYLLVELLGGVLAALCYQRFGFTPQMLLCFAVAAILTTIAFIDQDTMTIPNGLNIILVVPAVLAVFLFPQISLVSRAIGLLAVSLPMFLLTLVIPDCFGGGDIKLVAVCGFLLGWQGMLLTGFIALLLGGAYGVVLLVRSRENRKSHFAFGPYLCIGGLVAILYGEAVIAAYLRFFGL